MIAYECELHARRSVHIALNMMDESFTAPCQLIGIHERWHIFHPEIAWIFACVTGKSGLELKAVSPFTLFHRSSRPKVTVVDCHIHRCLQPVCSLSAACLQPVYNLSGQGKTVPFFKLTSQAAACLGLPL
jgi:hypothetical protein